MILGVSDQKLSASIQDVLEVQCQHMGVVTEVMRGIRLYFHRLVKGLTAITASKAQLGKRKKERGEMNTCILQACHILSL